MSHDIVMFLSGAACFGLVWLIHTLVNWDTRTRLRILGALAHAPGSWMDANTIAAHGRLTHGSFPDVLWDLEDEGWIESEVQRDGDSAVRRFRLRVGP